MAWDDYLYWQQNDKQILKKINQLIKDIKRDPFEGIGKPEPLKHELSGFWSRRITDWSINLMRVGYQLLLVDITTKRSTGF